MEEDRVTPRRGAGHHGAHEPAGEPPPADGRVGADRTDLGPPREAHPLTRHGDQPAVHAQAEVVPELERPGEEGSGLRPRNEVEDVVEVVRAEVDGRGVDGRGADRYARPAGHHLERVEAALLGPPDRRRAPEQDGDPVRPDEAREGRPVLLGRFVG